VATSCFLESYAEGGYTPCTDVTSLLTQETQASTYFELSSEELLTMSMPETRWRRLLAIEDVE